MRKEGRMRRTEEDWKEGRIERKKEVGVVNIKQTMSTMLQ